MTAEPSPEPGFRWRLHRAGVVNIWQFGERTLDLSGGRVILQGTNGSGKSRTLELLLPLCLDGDFHHLGAKGYDTVSIRRLMLDDYTGGPNRIGYAWIEVRRATQDGKEEFLTAGIGVKASRTTQGISGSWRFVTSERIGIDFDLAGPDKTPLDQKGLKERLGSDAVPEDARAMQQRIAPVIYGIHDEHRYDDLLHLQRTLRNPEVGVRAVEGQLEEYLSSALPPLDPQVVTRLANQFQDLESIRENIQRLRLADSSLSRFLTDYADYAAGALRARAEDVIQADQALVEHRDGVEDQRRLLDAKQLARAKLQLSVDDEERQEKELDAQVRELEGNQEYQDLNAKHALVEIQRGAAHTGLVNAANCRVAEQNATDAVMLALKGMRDAAESASQAAGRARELFGRARLDPGMLPVPSPPAAAESVRSTDHVQIDIDASAAPRIVERLAPPCVDLDESAVVCHRFTAESELAMHAAAQRRALAISLKYRATDLEAEHQQVEALRVYAEEATTAAKQAVTDHHNAVQEATAAAQQWLRTVQSWAARSPFTTKELGEPPLLSAAEDFLSNHDLANQTRTAGREWASPAIVHARQAATAAEAEFRALTQEKERILEDLRERQNGIHTPPPSFHYASAQRSGRPGAAVYQLVDFHPDLSERHRAGLEAALQASGLLDAWVTADGDIADPDLHDLLAIAQATSPGWDASHTLASVLVPASAEGSPVAVDVVTRLLGSVRIGENPARATTDGLSVSLTGRWRAGSLAGAWTKDAAEHIGASTREAYRLRRITELLSLLDELDSQLETQQQDQHNVMVSLSAWEQHVEIFPDTGPVAAVRATVAAAEEHSRRAEEHAQEKIKVHAGARGQWGAKHADLSRQAAEANLPDRVATLTERLQDIDSAIEATIVLLTILNERYPEAIHDVAAPMAAYATSVSARKEAEANATTGHGAYAQAAKALALLVESLGIRGEEYDAQLSGLRRKLRGTRSVLPKLREDREKAATAVIRLSALLEAAEPTERQKQQTLDAAEQKFDEAAAGVGVWAAAVGNDQEPPVDRSLAVQTAMKWQANLVETDLLNELQTLRDNLPDGHSASASRENDLLIVLVSDGEEVRSVVTAAGEAASRLAEHREQLDTRYREIFEEFLLRDLAEHLRLQIDAADDLCRRMNDILSTARSSQGVHVQLSWDPSSALDDATREALALVRTSFATRTPEQDAQLRRALQERIEAERDVSDAHYSQVLAHALDYRSWYAFTVRVQDTGPDGQPRNRLLRRLSSGETRLISYVTLFAAAGAFYDALTMPGSAPLRLVLLDEAFERLDDPTITRLLELLADLDMDWVITWPGGSAFSPKIDRMQIYDIFRPKGAPGIALMHTTWDGVQARRSQ